MSLAPGVRVGAYEVLAVIGTGGMGEVYRARDLRLERDVALKLLHKREAQDHLTVERFLREARAASALNHPNIITIHEIGDVEAGRYIVMELVDGRTVRDLMTDAPSIAVTVRVVAQVAKALSVAHAADIVHRDIKPENVMVRADGYVKLLDFGLARVMPTEADNRATVEQTTAGVLLGTLRYMSPEQARGETVGSATDVFSLGLVLYELATGHHPFASDSAIGVLNAILSQRPLPPTRLNPEIPAALESLMLQMLERDPRLRPDAAHVALALEGLEGSRPTANQTFTVARTRRHIVGRERERAEIFRAFERVAGGQGTMVCVSGEPGIGKTTLVDDVLEEAAQSGTAFMMGRGRCSERLAGAETYLPLLELLEHLIQGPGGDAVARFMKVVAPSWHAQLTPLMSADSGRLPELKTISRDRLKRELVQLVQEVSRTQPLVLVLDDVHWIDASSTDMLAYLTSRFDQMRVLVVVAYRPTELLGIRNHPFVPVKLDLEVRGASREIELSGLARESIDRLIALEFPDHHFPPEFCDLIHTKTEGSPLFASELLRYLRDKRVITQAEDGWRLTDRLPDIARELPDSVRSMIQRQIERLDDVDRRLLVCASVQGHEFDAAIVAHVVGLDPADVEDRLEALAKNQGLLRRIDERELPDRTFTLRYRFAHVLYQNALYLSLTPSRKVALSRAVAEAILKFHGDQSASLALELALLFEAARDFARAAAWFTRASRNSARIAGYHESVLLARRGLAAATSLPAGGERDRQELDLQIALASSLIATKGYAAAETEKAYEEALALCARVPETPQIFPVLYGRWVFHTVSGNMMKSVEIAREFATLAEQQKADGPRVVSHRLLGTSFAVRGQLEAARAHLDSAIALYDHEQHQSLTLLYGQDVKIAGMCYLSLTLWLLGYEDQAMWTGRDALARAKTLANTNTIAYATLHSGALLHALGGHRETVAEAVEQLRKLGSEHHLPTWDAVWRVFGGWLADREPDAGIPMIREGLDRLDAIHSVFLMPIFLTWLAERCGSTGRPDEGLSALDRALTIVNTGGEVWFEPEVHRVRGRLTSQISADHAAAEQCFRTAVNIARQHGSKSLELRALIDLGTLLGDHHRGQEARELLLATQDWAGHGFELADLRHARELADRLQAGAAGNA